MTKEINEIDQQIGARIKSARRQRGMSQEKLAAGVGLTFQQIQKYERGANRVSCSRLVEFAEILQLPVIWFFPENLRGNLRITALDAEKQKMREQMTHIAGIAQGLASAAQEYAA